MAAKRKEDDGRIQELLAKTRIVPVDVREQMGKCFISYAMAVNVSRAIPDARDGLKPVHRRILYAMHDMNNTFDKPTKKCARIVGEVLGKYHPHGDQSVYAALVRLAQWFNMMNPLVDGQGNFGTVDGDPPAASRYTEARLSKISNEMLRDIKCDTVDFYPNFDGTLSQPRVLPAHFPNLLTNGSEGIAVGMATSIPPHNLRETIDGAVALLDDPETTVERLMRIIRGPDFPTGGIVCGLSGIAQAYRTGSGRMVVRAKTEIEKLSDGRELIVATELPYQVNKASLVKAIAKLAKSNKIEGIKDVRDESDRTGIRLVVEVDRRAQADVVLSYLFKRTDLRRSTGINFLALSKGRPEVMGLKRLLTEYLEHRIEVCERKTRFDLAKAEEREHIVRGLIVAIENIDEAIRIIKESRERNEAREALIDAFGLDAKQADAILDMRLASLTGLQIEQLREEEARLKAQIADYRDILAKPERVRAIVKADLERVRDTYGKPRRTAIEEAEEDLDDESLHEKRDIAVSMTYEGYIKRTPIAEYRAQGRGGVGVSAHRIKDEDLVMRMLVCNSHDDILFFSNLGRAYKLRGYKIPEASKNARGRAMPNVLPNLAKGETITAALAIESYESGHIVMVTRNGQIRKSRVDEFESVRANGKIAATLDEGDELVGAALTTGGDDIIVATRNGMCIRFSEGEVRRTGRGSRGVRSIRLSEGDRVADMAVPKEGMSVATISERGFGKRTALSEYRRQGRAGRGMRAGRFDAKTGALVAMKLVSGDEDLVLIADNGTMIRTRASEISLIGRNTRGVTVMRLRDGGKVVSMAAALRDEDAEHEPIEADEAELRAAEAEAADESDE